MNCKTSRELFPDFIGEELSTTDTKELKDHLKVCQGCRQELSLLTRTKTALQVGWPDEPIPRSLIFEYTKPSPSSFWSQLWKLKLPKAALGSLAVTACFIVSLMSLSLARTQIQVGNGVFKLSFGSSSQTAPTAQKIVQSSSPGAIPAQYAGSRESLQALIDQALQRWQQTQDSKLQQGLLDTKSELETKRNLDLRSIAKELQYLQSVQQVVWKEAMRNNSNIETLADYYVKSSSTEPSRQ